MRRRRIAAAVSIVLVTSLISVVRLATPAAAAGPSTEIEQTTSVSVTQPNPTTRNPDQASIEVLTGDQPAAATTPGGGTATATPLSATASWQVSPHTGDFSWSYPLRVPPVPGGLAPSLALSYASSVVDGRTSATNNQASWVGDGWDLSAGFIDRAYLPCKQGGDLCWRNDNATAAFGSGGRLIHEATNTWRSESDNGSRIERFTGAGNGDNDGEYWRITTVDGTQYYFGSRPEAASTWTVPVRGDNDGEPCAGTRCDQAWRWNLDKVVDTHGNTILYGYEVETNKYGEQAVSYVRGGVLRSAAYGPLVDGRHSARVDFVTADRCVPGSDCTPSRPANWPDVSWAERCDAANCPGKLWPTFWTTKRLATVTANVLKSGDYAPVDSWTLAHTFPYSGDDATRAALWLRSITHTGHVGGDLSLPAVTFEGVRKANRVSLPGNFVPLNRYRISAVVSEYGGVVDVKYRDPNCTPTSLPTQPEHNTRLCQPVRWYPPGSVVERTDYFHKYVVSSVEQLDRYGSTIPARTRYEYLDGAAWHYDTSEFTEDARRTWNEFRGFARVRVRTGDDGDASGKVTMTEQRYHRGMAGDTLPGGATRQVQVDDGAGGVRPDHNWLRGFNYHTATHLGETDTVVSKTVSAPSWQGPSATRGKITSYLVRTGSTREFTALAAGAWREKKVETTFDDRGLPLTTKDTGTGADDRCTTMTYARNTEAWILDGVTQSETVACGVTPAVLLSATRTHYDGQGHGAAPIRGDVTRVEAAREPGTFQQQSRAEYDGHGRPVKAWDALDRVTSTAYTQVDGLLVQEVVTNAKGHTVSTSYQPARGLAVKTVDVNGKATEHTYDALGRLVETWLPNRPRSINDQGNHRHAYLIRNDGPSVVSTSRIGPTGNYLTSKTIYDGLLRVRQTQEPAAGGGRLLTDTRYDTFGRAYRTSGAFYNGGAVDDNLWVPLDSEVPAITNTLYDEAGRVSATELWVNGTMSKRTTTVYGGDRTTVTPPVGAPPTTTVTDVHGQVTELVKAGQSTRYTYTPAGQLASITDPAGNIWRYHYDLLGRRIKTEDVDKGMITAGYDAAGQQTSTTDARGVRVDYQYDLLGRPTAARHGDKVLADWTYDDPTVPNGVGLPAKSTRYQDGHPYVTQVLGYSALGKPTRTQVLIPEVEQTLAGPYTTIMQYNADGSLRDESLPAIGDLKQETVTHTYDDAGRPKRTYGGYDNKTVDYVAGTDYTRYGEPSRWQLGTGTKRAWITSYRQLGTRWLERTVVDAEVPAPMQSDTSYTYDAAGGITSIATQAPGQPMDRQCFRYDEQRRLLDAWTPAAGCAVPDATTLGGPAAYWQSFTYDAAGNRTSDRERTYGYGPGHRLETVTKGTTVQNFAHDAAGNTTDHAGMPLEWDALGHSTKAGETTFAYAADGSRLLRRDPSGSTLYLNGQELRLDKATGVRRGTRYYSHGGKTLAVRAGGRLTWLAGDHQGSAQLAIDAETMSVSRRRFDPFGAPRGPQNVFPSDTGFVGGVKDASTGLTHLGARDYDPATGRFLSVDPILLANDPQQLNAYGYANNSPVTYSDPTGLIRTICPDGECRNGGYDPGTSPASTYNPPVALPGAAPSRTGPSPSPSRGSDPLEILKRALATAKANYARVQQRIALAQARQRLENPTGRTTCAENTSWPYLLLGGAMTCTTVTPVGGGLFPEIEISQDTTTNLGSHYSDRVVLNLGLGGTLKSRTSCTGSGAGMRCVAWQPIREPTELSEECVDARWDMLESGGAIIGGAVLGAMSGSVALTIGGAVVGGAITAPNAIRKVQREC